MPTIGRWQVISGGECRARRTWLREAEVKVSPRLVVDILGPNGTICAELEVGLLLSLRK